MRIRIDSPSPIGARPLSGLVGGAVVGWTLHAPPLATAVFVLFLALALTLFEGADLTDPRAPVRLVWRAGRFWWTLAMVVLGTAGGWLARSFSA